MPKRIKTFFKKVLLLLQPVILRIAQFYGIKTEKIGIHDRTIISGNNRIFVHGNNDVMLEADLEIPESIYFNTRSGNIYIGRNTIFGENVMLVTGKHYNIREADESGKAFNFVPEKGRDIVIGRNCFIASGAIVIGGVKIGDYSVVAAGAVVTKDVPQRVCVAGIPAKIIKQL
jgi:acetyltransferase-like isoleucine patch superfamily enzyme